MLLTQQVLIRDIIPETVHLFQCDSLHKEREVTITQYFPLVVVIAGHLALETYDMLFGSISPFVLLQIFMNTIEQSWMVAFEGACRIQHIFDNLLQPFAVRLVREKNVDIKVVSSHTVHDKYWDADTLSYKRTTAVPATDQKRLPEQMFEVVKEHFFR